jgi:hypothetical protein
VRASIDVEVDVSAWGSIRRDDTRRIAAAL